MNIIRISFLLTVFLLPLANSAYVNIETVMEQGKGFVIGGGPGLGALVDGIGDFNGDGYDDVIVSTWTKWDPYDSVFVIYGSKQPRPEIRVDRELHPSQGFAIRETEPDSTLGYFVSGIGDINGDGLADIMVSAGMDKKGAAYIIFGSRTPLSTLSPQKGLDPSQGFAILGTTGNYEMGGGGGRAGDINGDGIDDFMVLTDTRGKIPSKVYVIFGSKEPFSTMIPSEDFKPSQGFIISGEKEYYQKIGNSLDRAGDVNGDGIDDIIVGAFSTDSLIGAAYVIYGSREPFQNMVPSLGLTRSQGFAILGNRHSQELGNSVRGAGDVNGDGIDDIIIGAEGLANRRGAAYVIYGNKNGSDTITPNRSLDASQGFALYGDLENSNLGQSVSGIGDINQDGIDDVIVVAGHIHGGLGEAYIIYGKKNHTSFVIPATGLDSSQGIVLHRGTYKEGQPFYVGASANAGDVNGDGIDDIILGCTNSRVAYIIYGWKNCSRSPDPSCLHQEEKTPSQHSSSDSSNVPQRENQDKKDNLEKQDHNEEGKTQNQETSSKDLSGNNDTSTWIWRTLLFIILFVILYRPVRQFLVQRNIIGQSHLQARNTNPSQLPAYSHLERGRD